MPPVHRDMNDHADYDIRLYTDNNGVTHWRYGMRGVLLVCGQEQFYNSAYVRDPELIPTCMQCVAMVSRDQHKGPV
jgi:hypothetical protein